MLCKVDGSKRYITTFSDYGDGAMLEQTYGEHNHKNHIIDVQAENGAFITDKNGTRRTLVAPGAARDESIAVNINGLYMAGNHGVLCAHITADGHNKTVADIGTLWEDAQGTRWVFAGFDESEGEKYIKLVCDEKTPGENNYVFNSVVATTKADGTEHKVLTRVIDGKLTNETIPFSATTAANQLYPFIKDRVGTVTAVHNGVETVIDLGESQTFYADRIIMNETYTLTDPTYLTKSLQENRPANGYASLSDVDYTKDAPEIFKYEQTITIMEDGTVITEVNHKILSDFAEMYYFGYAYYMKADFGGGIWRTVPGQVPFSQYSLVVNPDGSIKKSAEKKEFDFGLPYKIYQEQNGLPAYKDYPWVAYTGSDTWVNPDGPAPNRMIDHMKNANNRTEMGFVSGFLPLYDGTPENRKLYCKQNMFYYKSLKAYPFFISGDSGNTVGITPKSKTNSTIKGVFYKKYQDIAKYSDKVSVYTINYNNDIYYYIDFLEADTISVPVTGAISEVVENVGNVSYTVTNGMMTVSGDARDSLVIRTTFA